MKLHRQIFSQLLGWKGKPDRKPLVIQGARQTGKTWCMKEFGKEYYSDTAYFNFERDVALRHEFEQTKNPQELLPVLELYCGHPIKESTLIIFDEIQECNEALNSLKYFYENLPKYNIICAGSLLGVALRKGGTFPVGCVEFLQIYPLTFGEFLYNADKESFQYIDALTQLKPLPLIIYEKISKQYVRYLICGGMPKAVIAMLESNSIEKVDFELEQLLISYSLDFKKHATAAEVPKITAIWTTLPSQLSKENKKFIYGIIKSGARAREYESALQWLQLSGLIYKINNVSKPLMPLSAYESTDAFKIYAFDIGILRALAQIPAHIFINESTDFREFKGAFAENAVLENLIAQLKVMPRYWTSNGKAEVDFVMQTSDGIIPLEVKAADNISSRSLKVYIEKYNPVVSFIISSKNISEKEKIINLPAPLVPWLTQLPFKFKINE